jgi:hypothetical protein
VFFSEALFIGACCDGVEPKRFIESGRARGQSTVLLAKSFPHLPIISIEFDRASPDCQVASRRLASFANVELRFGDSMTLVPELVRSGDVVIIDGPKHFHALRLAIQLLRMRQAELIFIHDLHRGTSERRFLDREFPGIAYSDDPEFVRRYSYLDKVCWDTGYPIVDVPSRATLFGVNGAYSYGPTFACLSPQIHRVRVATGFRLQWAAWKG